MDSAEETVGVMLLRNPAINVRIPIQSNPLHVLRRSLWAKVCAGAVWPFVGR